MLRAWLGLALLTWGCTGGDEPPEGTESTAQSDSAVDTAGTPTEPQGWRWEEVDVEGVSPGSSWEDPRWGAVSAGPLMIGGVDGAMQATADVLSLDASDGTLRAEVRAQLAVPRYCACAMYDPGRDEVLVIGGRDDRFVEAPSAELLSLATGEPVPLDAVGADDHPVGCHAFFSPVHDRGWVVGGYGNSAGFGTTTWRYDPAARELVPLDIPGPSGRYDGGVEVLEDGDGLLVGGMGAAGFDSQVWRFDADAEVWTELSATSDGSPPGRRFPWTALHDGALLYGYGTDSPMGTSVLRDLWAFDLATGAWSEVEVEGRRPAARAFAARLPGPEGTLGVLAFGASDTLEVFGDAWALRAP
jgi:hypothetical protein